MDKENTVLYDLKKVPLSSERNEIRRKRLKRFLIFLLCIICVLIGVFIEKLTTLVSKDDSSEVSVYRDIEKIMENTWLYGDRYEDLATELENKALYGMTSFDFDPYTSYMSTEEMNTFSDSINGDYVGIGVEYSYINGKALIKRVFYSSPAEKAGLQAGDAIVKIDGVDVEGLDTQGIREMVLGVEGTDVVLQIERGEDVFDVTVVRGTVNSTIFAYVKDDILIMELNSFGSSTYEECIKYLDLHKDLKKIIIDLRANGGGYQGSVRDICGLFIGREEVYLRQKGANGVEMVDVTPKNGPYYDNFEKIVLLTSGDTASAAEVFTIALKEKCDNVTIVGEKTFGKGVIQTNKVLRNGGVLKITSYYWYSPNGVLIDKVGIAPDIEVMMPDIYYQTYFDMEEDETYAYDSVSDTVEVAQKALNFLGYDTDRNDGYFDASTLAALKRYKADNGLEDSDLLDQATFSSIVAQTRRSLAYDVEKDPQFQMALSVLEQQ